MNKLHVRFPEFFKKKFDRNLFQKAHELNLSIHWLEYELANLYGKKQQYIFNLDFNHFPKAYNLKMTFPENELSNFSPVLEFGSLHLHYIYIGRHFLEMFDARDMVCPASHFRAQHEFNATCGLVFSEPTDILKINQDMQDYYVRRGGESFSGFAYEDPKIAKGFFKVGQLEDAKDYGELSRRQALREKLKSSVVQSWRIIQNIPPSPQG